MADNQIDKNIAPIAPPKLHEKVFKIVSNLPGDSVLDVPTGYGALAQKLLDLGKHVTAGDIDVTKFKATRDHAHLKLIRLDLNEKILPLPDNQFDIAISVEGIEHLQSQWSFIKNLCRVLKPGGHLVLTTPNILNVRSRFRYLMEGRYEHFKRPLVKDKSWSCDLENYHIAPISFFELQFMLESCGFSIQSLHTNQCRAKNILTMLLKPLFGLFYRNKNYRDKKRQRGDHEGLYKMVMTNEVFFWRVHCSCRNKNLASC